MVTHMDMWSLDPCETASAACPWCGVTCEFVRYNAMVRGIIAPDVLTRVKLGSRNYRCPHCQGYFNTNEPKGVHWRPADHSTNFVRWRLRYKGKCAEVTTSAYRVDWAGLGDSELREQVEKELARMIHEHKEEVTPDVNRPRDRSAV